MNNFVSFIGTGFVAFLFAIIGYWLGWNDAKQWFTGGGKEKTKNE